MAKSWTITLATSSVSIQESSGLSPSTPMVFAAPLGVSYISLGNNNGVYDNATHSYIIVRSGPSSFKIDYSADTLTPAKGTNTVTQYIIKLGRYMNGDSAVSF